MLLSIFAALLVAWPSASFPSAASDKECSRAIQVGSSSAVTAAIDLSALSMCGRAAGVQADSFVLSAPKTSSAVTCDSLLTSAGFASAAAAGFAASAFALLLSGLGGGPIGTGCDVPRALPSFSSRSSNRSRSYASN